MPQSLRIGARPGPLERPVGRLGLRLIQQRRVVALPKGRQRAYARWGLVRQRTVRMALRAWSVSGWDMAQRHR